jgi:hypothetical protein
MEAAGRSHAAHGSRRAAARSSPGRAAGSVAAAAHAAALSHGSPVVFAGIPVTRQPGGLCRDPCHAAARWSLQGSLSRSSPVVFAGIPVTQQPGGLCRDPCHTAARWSLQGSLSHGSPVVFAGIPVTQQPGGLCRDPCHTAAHGRGGVPLVTVPRGTASPAVHETAGASATGMAPGAVPHLADRLVSLS